MIKEDNTQIPISNDEKSLVYQTLFSSPDTGLLKNGNDASDVTSLLNTVLSRMTKGNQIRGDQEHYENDLIEYEEAEDLLIHFDQSLYIKSILIPFQLLSFWKKI